MIRSEVGLQRLLLGQPLMMEQVRRTGERRETVAVGGSRAAGKQTTDIAGNQTAFCVSARPLGDSIKTAQCVLIYRFCVKCWRTGPAQSNDSPVKC